MTLHLNALTVDSRDPAALAEFWAEALGWMVIDDSPGEVMIAPAAEPSDLPGAFPFLFLVNDDPKQAKNRLHLDLVPDDQDNEVRRLEGLGARRVDIGQGDVSWVVMADPEGNEFCVLRSYEG